MNATASGDHLPSLPDFRLGREITWRHAFETYADILLNLWDQKKKVAAPRRAENANSWFKREAYKLLRHYIEARKTSIFRRVIVHDRRPTKLVEDALQNPFKLGLLAMVGDDDWLNRHDRLVYGNQMLYAWAHDVPPEFITGFLSVSGRPAEIARKIKSGAMEPGFEERFKPDRFKLDKVD